jgi:hypothetical protein
MGARQAVALIRRLRGIERVASALTLTVRLAKTIDNYLDEYPDTTWGQARAAVLNVLDIIPERDDP